MSDLEPQPPIAPEPIVPATPAPELPTLAGLPYVPAKGQEPAPGSIAAHCAAKKMPAWLCGALQACHPVNKTLTDAEFAAEAQRVAGFKLGR